MNRSRARVVLTVLLAMSLVGSVAAVASAQGSPAPVPSAVPGGPVHGQPPTKGPMPNESGAPIPDFIGVTERMGDGFAGYIAVLDMMPNAGTYPWWYQQPPIPVYGEDLHTLVGFMFEGKGFVPLGVDPNTVPDFEVVAGPSVAP